MAVCFKGRSGGTSTGLRLLADIFDVTACLRCGQSVHTNHHSLAVRRQARISVRGADVSIVMRTNACRW
jgi:hypothetical protein